MSDSGTGPESEVPRSSAETHCRLQELAEAIQAGTHPEHILGVVACMACYGIFNIHLDAGENPSVDNIVFVPCIQGYSNNPEAHLEG